MIRTLVIVGTLIVLLATSRGFREAVFEASSHCLEYGEILACAEFDHTAQLTPRGCALVLALADSVCAAGE